MFLVLPEHRKGSVRYFVSPSTAGLKSEVPHTVRFEIMCPLSPLPPPPHPQIPPNTTTGVYVKTISEKPAFCSRRKN